MLHNNKSPPTLPTAAVNKTDKHTPITPIKIVNCNTVLKTANTKYLQCDNPNDGNNDDSDWITVEPKSPNYAALNSLDDDTNNMDTDQLNINLSETKTHIY
ncbi:hypothetical protein QTP88_004046 [Uroleucon formosanum]